MELLGYTLWARQTLDSDVFCNKPDKWFKIWFYLVSRVNFKKTKQFQRGECHTTYSKIADSTGATKHQIHEFIRWSKKCQMLTTQKTTRGMIITIVLYSKYQDAKTYRNHTENLTKTTQKPHRNHTIVEECKNDKNDNKDIYIGQTPKQQNREFFSSLVLQEKLISTLMADGRDEKFVRSEIKKFIDYWTELTPNGTKQLWETKKTFQVKLRLLNWFSRARGGGGYKTKEQKGIVIS